MPTVVNQTPPSVMPEPGGSNMGFFVAILLFLFIMLFIFYALPFLRNSMGQLTPQVNIPSHVDVNVKQSK